MHLERGQWGNEVDCALRYVTENVLAFQPRPFKMCHSINPREVAGLVMVWDEMRLGRLNWTLEFLSKGLKTEERRRSKKEWNKKGRVIMWAISFLVNCNSASKPVKFTPYRGKDAPASPLLRAASLYLKQMTCWERGVWKYSSRLTNT